MLVSAGVVALCLLPVAVAAWPVARVGVEPQRLREQILASSGRSYSGYVDTNGDLRLPDLPAVGDVAALFTTLRLRAWYARPSSATSSR